MLSDHDIVVDLAAISQPDPQGFISEQLFYEINYLVPVRIAKLASKYGVEKYVFASSCSVYGYRDVIVNESSEPNPVELLCNYMLRQNTWLRKTYWLLKTCQGQYYVS